METSSFCNLKLNYSKFHECNLQSCSFIACQLENSSFLNNDLSDTIFEDCNLVAVDFTGSTNYQISVVTNNVKGSRHDPIAALGLLQGTGILIN